MIPRFIFRPLALRGEACFFKVMSQIELPPRASLTPPRFRPFRTIAALMLREMSTTYGQSAGGYIWAILKPVGMIVILSLVFSLMVRKPSIGTNFMLFYATGYLPYSFFSEISAKSANALRYSRPLLAYASVTWIDAVLARLILNVITAATVFSIVITAIMLVVETRTVLNLIHVINGVGICILIGFGVGLCNAILEGFWPVWTQIWSIITRPLFLASGIIFLYEDTPQAVQNILWWNPLVHGTALTRAGFYPTYQASFTSLIYCYGLALILIALGLVFMRANYRTLLER
ncbi:MAG: ABC transporter permease [Yoonia sp.]|nr:ABC transporter permease [Yoonia sp.]